MNYRNYNSIKTWILSFPFLLLFMIQTLIVKVKFETCSQKKNLKCIVGKYLHYFDSWSNLLFIYWQQFVCIQAFALSLSFEILLNCIIIMWYEKNQKLLKIMFISIIFIRVES
jgi:hypothetical protein